MLRVFRLLSGAPAAAGPAVRGTWVAAAVAVHVQVCWLSDSVVNLPTYSAPHVCFSLF